MPGAFVYGIGPDDDLGDVLADLLLRGDRIEVDGGVVLSPRRSNADRQRAYRARKALRARNADALRGRNADLDEFDPEFGNSNGNPPRGGSTVTDVPGVTRNALRVTPRNADDAVTHALPPLTDEERERNRAASAALRERMRRGDL